MCHLSVYHKHWIFKSGKDSLVNLVCFRLTEVKEKQRHVHKKSYCLWFLCSSWLLLHFEVTWSFVHNYKAVKSKILFRFLGYCQIFNYSTVQNLSSQLNRFRISITSKVYIFFASFSEDNYDFLNSLYIKQKYIELLRKIIY